MRSLQDYIDIYRNIAQNLNLQGDSVEVIAQMLANASYISEVENIAYVQEASLEKATLINSKIQHCVNDMYSVFRGSCPRVIIRFKPTKYFNFNVYDEIVSSNNFKVYYLGYYSNNTTRSTTGTQAVSSIDGFIYSPVTIPPASTDDNTWMIVGLLAKETVSRTWSLDQSNTYYVNCLDENLSSDLWVKVNGDYFDTTREFSSHILNGYIFDLTLPSFGSRLYVADIFRDSFNREESQTPANTSIEAFYYKFSELSSYNESELRKINIKGAELVSFDSSWLSTKGYEETNTGICLLDEIPRDDVTTIHYKANRDRYVNSILRSNSDIGVVLEEMYPEKVRSGGTSYEFNTIDDNSSINIYYVPYSDQSILTDSEIQDFISSRTAYYVTDFISVEKGSKYIAVFNIDLELYQNSNVDSEVKSILDQYGNKFNINLENSLEEIKALISKISNVKQILGIAITYTGEDGSQLNQGQITEMTNNLNKSYYQINYVINSIMQSSNSN